MKVVENMYNGHSLWANPKLLQTLQLNTLSVIRKHYTEFNLANKNIVPLGNIYSNRIMIIHYGVTRIKTNFITLLS